VEGDHLTPTLFLEQVDHLEHLAKMLKKPKVFKMTNKINLLNTLNRINPINRTKMIKKLTFLGGGTGTLADGPAGQASPIGSTILPRRGIIMLPGLLNLLCPSGI
jgi:hypothetical protein